MTDVRAAIADALEQVRAAAEAGFGWTHLEITAATQDGRVVLGGRVVAPRSIARLRAAIASRLSGLVIDTAAIELLHTDRFVALPQGVTELWRRPDRETPGELATELLEGDGPLEQLVEQGGATLVRACDGTLGWAHRTLGSPCAAPELPSSAGPSGAALAEHARGWIGAPYRLGGTRPVGVDCSGLVQRLLASIGARVPRHSADQLAIAAHEGEGHGAAGEIVALWSSDEAPCHVGLALGDGNVVHASRSRGRVVVEPRAQWSMRAQRVAHVPLAAIEALQHRIVGQRGLGDVLAFGRDD